MLRYQQYQPSPILSNDIECYWTLSSEGLRSIQQERMLPGGRVEIIFNFADPVEWVTDSSVAKLLSANKSIILGQRNRLCFAKPLGNINLFGIRFKHATLPNFIEEPVSDLLNKVIPCNEIFGKRWLEIEDRIYNTVTLESRISIIEKYFSSIRIQSMDHSSIHSIIENIQMIDDNRPIMDIGKSEGWSYKTTERKFLRYLGYPPKHYAKIIRFNKAIRLICVKDGSFTKIGYECGYYDQSHFIKDFTYFTGTPPSRFFLQDHPFASFLVKNQAV